MEKQFAGKVALVTGAAGQGIGQGIARRLAEGGATVIVTDSSERRVKEVTEAMTQDYDTPVAGYQMDVTDRPRIAEVIDDVAKKYGPVQILVNNAAWNVLGNVFEYDFADWDKVIDVDLTGPYNTIRLALPGMRDAGGGAIINVSSIGADLAAGSGEMPYAVSKGGMNTLTRQVAKDAGPYGIRCNAIALNLVTKTHFTDTRVPHLVDELIPRIPLGRIGTADDIVDAAEFLASDKASYITGEILNVSGGFYMRA